MLDNIREKIRALVQDGQKSGFETFVYGLTNIFTVASSNIGIVKVLLDGNETDDYTFDIDTNKITITASGIGISSIIEVDYLYYKYSDTEIDSFIRSALVFISIYSHSDEFNYELEGESVGDMEIVPTMDSHIGDLVSLVSSILIKPNWVSYKLPNLSVVYPVKMSKEERIEKLIGRFNEGIGINEVIQFDIFPFNY